MDVAVNTIHEGDCVEGLNSLPADSVDLVFADPPFNIGYDYDVYEDRVEDSRYLDWSRTWIAAVHRVLKPDGTFWLAIGDEYAAELKVISQQLGFHCRSWVIWYYTFGVNCSRKFTRSHAHLFHFVMDPDQFTFREQDLENRIPSARQLVYNDKRANPKGRLPDDTWIIRPASVIGELVSDDGTWSPEQVQPTPDEQQTWTLRPQDVAASFGSDEDTWYFPRVAGTFKERAGFHGCQMPEQLLGRIIRTCAADDALVLDPFAGSAATLAVAKKLGRSYLGFELSPEYVRLGLERLESVRVGDRLNGSAEPTMSAPQTSRSGGRSQGGRGRKGSGQPSLPFGDDASQRQKLQQQQLELTLRGVTDAFVCSHDGYSEDRVVADPELNERFASACRQLGLAGDTRTWNVMLFRLRKAGQHAHINTTRRSNMSLVDCDPFLFASEIAWKMMLDARRATSLDEILCDPFVAAEFTEMARRFAPGYTDFQYRWAALKLRKHAHTAKIRGSILAAPSQLGLATPIQELRLDELPSRPGVYLLTDGANQPLYAGETLDLRGRLSKKFAVDDQSAWHELASDMQIQTFPTESRASDLLAWESCLVTRFAPRLNLDELKA